VPIFSSKLTYGDFRRTGVQDCQNAVQLDEFDYEGGGTAEEIVERSFQQWLDDGMKEQWFEQNDDFEDLDPEKCFEAWAAGWKSRAEGYVQYELDRRAKRRADEDEHENPPANWWRRPAPPKDRQCYRTKIEALTKFLEANREIVENYGGADYQVSPSEFDSVNHKYNLTGKKAVRTIADAVWVAMPVGKPYCLDRIDLDALNGTSPAREADMLFVLPDSYYAAQMAEQEAQHYAPVVSIEDIPEPDWVTEHFPPLPAMPEGPMRMHLQRRDSSSGSRGVETYQTLPPLPPLEDIRPVNVELESQEPGVATFKFNPRGRAGEPPVAVGNVYDATTADGPTTFQIIGYFDVGEERRWRVRWSDGHLSALNMLHFAGYGARYSHHDYVAQPKIGNPAKTYQVEQQDQYGNWKVTDRGVTKTYADETATWVRSKGGKARVSVESKEPIDNPAWVTKLLAKHFEKLEDEIPSKWLPKLTKPTVQGGKFVAAMKEYGCGAYGCVLPTLDPNVVLKLTTDETEAEFAHTLADKLSAPVVVRYHLVRQLPDKYKKRPTYLLWRDSAEHVDKVEQTIAESGDADVETIEGAIAAQHKAAQEAFDALMDGEDATKLLQKWEDACREMGVLVPDLSELAEGMITNLHNNKVFFCDVHGGNIGMVKGRWVVVDPGHVAVLAE